MSYPAPASLRSPCDLRRADPRRRRPDGTVGRAATSHFGEQGARLTYGSYLRLEQLLDAQHLESEPPAHDELLFITIHQVYELWFQQLLHEATAARDAMLTAAARLWWAQHLLQRMHVIERVLVQQVDVLETMTPQDFLEFRQRAGAGQRLPVGAVPRAGVPLRRQGPVVRASGSAGSPTTRRARLQRRLDEPTPVGRVPARARERGAAGRRRRGGHRVAAHAPPTTARRTPTSGRSPRRCSSTTSSPRPGGRGTW